MSVAIQLQNVWKIFGDISDDISKSIRTEKITKKEAFERYNAVIGVSNVSFDVLRALNHNMSVFQVISNIRWSERHGNRIADEMKIFEIKFDLFLFRQLHVC